MFQRFHVTIFAITLCFANFSSGIEPRYKSGQISDKYGRTIGRYTEFNNGVSKTTTITEMGGNVTKYREPISSFSKKSNSSRYSVKPILKPSSRSRK